MLSGRGAGNREMYPRTRVNLHSHALHALSACDREFGSVLFSTLLHTVRASTSASLLRRCARNGVPMAREGALAASMLLLAARVDAKQQHSTCVALEAVVARDCCIAGVARRGSTRSQLQLLDELCRGGHAPVASCGGDRSAEV